MKDLLFSVTKKDFEVQTFRSGGKGGQHQNKTNSGVRIIHKESGARGESREERSQYQNKKIAFKRLCENPKFKKWIRIRSQEIIDKKTLEKKVEEMMSNKNIKVEYLIDGKWKEESNENVDV